MAKYTREQLKEAWRERQERAAVFLDRVERMGSQEAAAILGITSGEMELQIQENQEDLLLPMPPHYGRPPAKKGKKRRGG
ncbi:MAG TPA: hypothetical protein VH575_04045 [Gemmataceae bacterium]|jgi:DNA-directed RNA polymerase specialized sigma24 family protein